MLELIGLGFADGEYRPVESALIGEIARAMGIRDDEIAAMESWVIRQVALSEEAAGFWNTEDA